MAKTNEGKSKSARNATTHGCRSEKHVILPHESAADFDALLENLKKKWFEECLPFNDLEIDFVNTVARRQWQMLRCERQLDLVRDQLEANQPNPFDWSPEDHKKLTQMQRYFTTAERAFRNAWKDLLLLRKTRLTEAAETERLKRIYAKNIAEGITEAQPLTARPEPPGPPDHFITQPYPKPDSQSQKEPIKNEPEQQ